MKDKSLIAGVSVASALVSGIGACLGVGLVKPLTGDLLNVHPFHDTHYATKDTLVSPEFLDGSVIENATTSKGTVKAAEHVCSYDFNLGGRNCDGLIRGHEYELVEYDGTLGSRNNKDAVNPFPTGTVKFIFSGEPDQMINVTKHYLTAINGKTVTKDATFTWPMVYDPSSGHFIRSVDIASPFSVISTSVSSSQDTANTAVFAVGGALVALLCFLVLFL